MKVSGALFSIPRSPLGLCAVAEVVPAVMHILLLVIARTPFLCSVFESIRVKLVMKVVERATNECESVDRICASMAVL